MMRGNQGQTADGRWTQRGGRHGGHLFPTLPSARQTPAGERSVVTRSTADDPVDDGAV